MALKRRACFVFALCFLLFVAFGLPAATSDADQLSGNVDVFTKFYALVQQNYADPLNNDKAVYDGAIPGMLRTLDPHSNFFDPKEYQQLRDDQRGNYFGVGMTVGARGGKTVVMAPFPGSPAYKAGLRPGDVLLTVNGKSTDGLSTSAIADLLKGPRGTPATILVGREGTPEPLTFTVIRDEIKRRAVPEAFWVKPGFAYMRVLTFQSENTSAEMEETLKKLGEKNIQGLVLDLRGNGGGLLNEGVAVAGHFLQKGQVVVSHRGRSSPERPYVARNGGQAPNYPIVVLVDKSSASAAEIVAGALQDHDRAWILGEPTFGKGLVQTVYPLSENTGMALTTAHFYTPSGRLIQRDYSNKSFYDYYFHGGAGDKNMADVKSTDSGRTVYGGGGITPDEKYEPPKYDKFETSLAIKGAAFNFTRSYFASHDTHLPQTWMPDDALLTEFHDYLLKEGYKFTEAEYTQDRDWLKRALAREMYITAFNVDESDRVYAQTDPEVARAIQSMPQARALLEANKKILVRRSNPKAPAAEASAQSPAR
jgi:carboxyl-terminal processing protease